MLMHSANNLIGTVQMQFTDMESILNKTLIEMYGGLINLIMVIVGSVLAFAVSQYYLKIEFKKLEPLVQKLPNRYSPNRPELTAFIGHIVLCYFPSFLFGSNRNIFANKIVKKMLSAQNHNLMFMHILFLIYCIYIFLNHLLKYPTSGVQNPL